MKQVHPCKINLEVEIRIGFTTKRRRRGKNSKSSSIFRFQMSGHCGLERRARTSLLQCSSLPVMNHYSSHGSGKGAMVESAKMTLCCFIAKTPLLQISHFKTQWEMSGIYRHDIHDMLQWASDITRHLVDMISLKLLGTQSTIFTATVRKAPAICKTSTQNLQYVNVAVCMFLWQG